MIGAAQVVRRVVRPPAAPPRPAAAPARSPARRPVPPRLAPLSTVARPGYVRADLPLRSFAGLTPAAKAQVDNYIAKLSPEQLDKLAAMKPEEIARLAPQETGLGFFWIIIQVAYMAYAAKQAKDKKDKAKKAAEAAKKKAADQAKKDKAKLATLNRELNTIDAQTGKPVAAPAGGSSALPWFIGAVAIGIGGLYLFKWMRRK